MASRSSWVVFARNKLGPLNFESASLAVANTWKMVNVFKASGQGNHPLALAMAACAAGRKACRLTGCPNCNRSRRAVFAMEVAKLFRPLDNAGTHDNYFVTIIPNDSRMRLNRLPGVNWKSRRRCYERLLRRVLGPGAVARVGLDVDVRRRGRCCLHLHGVIAVPVGAISYRRLTERLVEAFNPHRIGAKRPVRKEWIIGRKGYWKVATYTMKSLFAVASKVHKHNGVFLGKREVPIRTFMSGIHPRARIIRIN